MHTVKQVADMAGVSVRTLHHYHDIGLLEPAQVGDNGYRYYGREELLRLQQILIHREMGIALADIGSILDAPDFDRLAMLASQRERVADQAARYAEMLRTIDRTIAQLKGDRAMNDADLYAGIVDPKKQAEHDAWLEEKYGPEIRDTTAASRRQMDALPDTERESLMAELKDIEQQLAEALRQGVPPQSTQLDPLISRHWDWVRSRWNRPAPVSAYAGLADTYLAHPDFVARYESIEKGLAAFLTTAIKSWVSRHG
jgi:MerR family transcriptional regulator, thiopeptide resistance regulator